MSVLAIVGGTLLGGATSLIAFSPGMGDIVSSTLNSFFQSRILDALSVTQLYRMGKVPQDEWQEEMKRNGLSPDRALKMYHTLDLPLGQQEILTLWYRYRFDKGNKYKIDAKWLVEQFDKVGVTPENVEEVLESNRPVPTLDDIIRFAIRDVYEPDQVKQGRLFEGLDKAEETLKKYDAGSLTPDESENLGLAKFLIEARKRGLSLEDTRYYWGSHWNVPSINQAFEMFQRLADNPDPNVRFTQKDMNTFFQVADIAPGYRERLQAIAYNPLGRVDIRRFDALGVFGEGQERQARLEQLYRHLGYSPQDAKLQTDFTIKLNSKVPRGQSRALILKYYRDGLWGDQGKEKATAKLKEIGYDQDQINDLLTYEDMKIIDSEEQAIIDTTKEQYLKGQITRESQIRDALAKAHLTNKL